MSEPRLEDVFKVSGVPTYTFVPPQEFASLLVNLRTPGRGLVVEGPSGIGKTTAVEKAIAKLNSGTAVSRLSARRPEDVSFITELPNETSLGTVLVDDFHKLPPAVKAHLADFLKFLADTEAPNSKLIILGINRAGDSLIDIASDLVNRIDIIRFETNDDDLVNDLLSKGEDALNIALNVKDEIVTNANGSFYLAQMLAREVCMNAQILERCDVMTNTQLSFEQVKSDVWERLSRTFHIRTKAFCLGTRQRTDGRAPYLHVLKWLAETEDWSLSTRDALREHPQLRGSVGQIVEKGYLEQLISGNTELDATVNFDGKQLTIEDPQYIFYLRNLPWRRFAEELGFRDLEFKSRYDFALSFAGEDRSLAQMLFEKLVEAENEVFYDKNEQHRILSENVEDYLRPIYNSEARFVVCFLSERYPKKVWTKFESDQFKERFEKGEVVPVWFANCPPGIFDESRKYGGFGFDPAKPADEQISQLADLLMRKINEYR